MSFKYTWRWFGPEDPIRLHMLKQKGISGIVSALHHIPNGEVWQTDEIVKRKAAIEKAGFIWEVVESLPVHEKIKLHISNYEALIDNYKTSLINLGSRGIKTVCYNFMPVLDWTRTDLMYTFPDGSSGLSYAQNVLAAFDLFVLKRPDAHKDYNADTLLQAERYFESINAEEVRRLEANILMGLPGAEESYTLDRFRKTLAHYQEIDARALRENLLYFLRAVIPVAEEYGIKIAIHPDDPPWGLFGLPRVVSKLEDVKAIAEAVPAENNGITLCSGSFGAGFFNDVAEIAKEMAPRIHFAHLRNVSRDEQLNFREENLLEGDVDIRRIIGILGQEQERRKQTGIHNWQIPVRPDHGNSLNGEDTENYRPGYSLQGRLKGLQEIQQLEQEGRLK